jgi:hypothetical protein
MRPHPVADGWAGSLFDKPVEVAVDRCVCHKDCPKYETCETEDLTGHDVYYRLRCVKGKFPACARCQCMTCSRYYVCKDVEVELEKGDRYRRCNRSTSITACPEYVEGRVILPEHHGTEPLWCEKLGTDTYTHYCQQPQNGRPDSCHCTHFEFSIRQPDRCLFAFDKPLGGRSPSYAHPPASEAPAPQEGRILTGTRCCHRVASKQNGGICSGCSKQKGTPCAYSRPPEHETEPAAPVAPTKAKKVSENYCESRGGNCVIHNGCRNGDVTCILKDKPPTQDCSDCLCPQCANNGKSCLDCKGPERCAKKGGKTGLCPDFHSKDGKEQDCLHNGCLCFTCQLVGEECSECPGPIRCTTPITECEDNRPSEDVFTPEHPYPGDANMPDIKDFVG